MGIRRITCTWGNHERRKEAGSKESKSSGDVETAVEKAEPIEAVVDIFAATESRDEALRKVIELTAIVVSVGNKPKEKAPPCIVLKRWQRATPRSFTTYLRSTAKASGAEKYDHTRHLLTITPSDQRESVDDDGFRTLLVRYGEESANVMIGFMQAPNDTHFSLVKVKFGGDSISPYEGRRK